MDKQVLEILIDMQKELKEVNNKLDKLEYKMNDGFETLELLSENSSTELNKVKIKVAKLEKRVNELNVMS